MFLDELRAAHQAGRLAFFGDHAVRGGRLLTTRSPSAEAG
jgi:hypothetical protein